VSPAPGPAPEGAGDLAEGDTVDTWDSEPVRTTDDGSYTLQLDPATLSTKYFGGTFLNYDLVVEDDGLTASWSSSVDLVDDELWRTDENARAADSVAAVDIDLEASSITMTDSFGEDDTHDLVVYPLP
jgi:hypothetical protein